MTNGDGRDTRADLIRRLREFVLEFPPVRLERTSPAIREAIGLIGEALAALDAESLAMDECHAIAQILTDAGVEPDGLQERVSMLVLQRDRLRRERDALHWEIARLRERLSVLQQPRIATEADCQAPWDGSKNGLRFRCKLCGHRFQIGDQWRFVYMPAGTGIGGIGIPNALVCASCDGPDVQERIRAHWQDAFRRFWFLFEDSDLVRAEARP